MHPRDELARATSYQRQAARASLKKARAKLTYSLAAASAVAVGMMGLVVSLVATAGWLLAKPFEANASWHSSLIIYTVLVALPIAGMGTEWLHRHNQPHVETSWWRGGLSVWAWWWLAAMLYCFCNGMPVLLTVAVLFIYGMPLQLLVLGLAVTGAGLMRYWEKRAIGRKAQ